MLIYGETPAERKASIMQNIALNRELIPLMTKANTTGEFSESIAILRQEIKDNFNDLVELKRWRRKEGYEPDQPYKPPSLIAYEKQLEADGEIEDYMEHQATLQAEIERLENKMKGDKE